MSLFHKNTLLGASGAGGAAEALYVDDVFSTFLYDGTGSSLSINNGIDLDGEGGLVWIKCRNSFAGHFLYDTERGRAYALKSHNSDAQDGPSSAGRDFSSFDNDGFTLGQNQYHSINNSGDEFVSWTFRKAPGFFDVVTYTGNGSSTGDSQTISHNLGSTPGFVIIKRTSGTGDWVCWHRSISTGQPRKYIELDSTNGTGTMGADIWGTVSSTEFEVKHNGTTGDSYEINKNGETYVAYFFAHDDQSFGDDSDEAIIKCGSVTTSSSGTASIDLGFEAQWVILKRTSGALDWYLWDTMRGIATGGDDQYLRPNISDAEGSANNIAVTPTGFDLESALASETWIYIAIRRPHKPPTDADDVFDVDTQTSDGKVTTSFVADTALFAQRASFSEFYWFDRLRGREYLNTNATAAAGTYSGTRGVHWDYQDGYDEDDVLNFRMGSNAASVYYSLKRAPGFYDVATYTADGSTTTFSHNLGVAPELMINKCRSNTFEWWTYAKDLGADKYLQLQSNAAAGTSTGVFGNTHPTATQMTFGSGLISTSGRTYVVYLFATLAGISKVGTYTGAGSGNSVDVDCGFSSGARFVVIKDTEASGNWYVYDSARGISSGNDPIKFFDSNAAEQTASDDIDPLNAGFTVVSTNSSLNTSGRTYLFLAIA